MGYYIAPSKQNTGRVSMKHEKLIINVNVDNTNVELSDEQLDKIKTDVVNEVKDLIPAVDTEVLGKIENNTTNIENIKTDIDSIKIEVENQNTEIDKKADEVKVNNAIDQVKENVSAIKDELNDNINEVKEIAVAALPRSEFEENIKPYNNENTIGQAVENIKQAIENLEIGNVESIEDDTINNLN